MGHENAVERFLMGHEVLSSASHAGILWLITKFSCHVASACVRAYIAPNSEYSYEAIMTKS